MLYEPCTVSGWLLTDGRHVAVAERRLAASTALEGRGQRQGWCNSSQGVAVLTSRERAERLLDGHCRTWYYRNNATPLADSARKGGRCPKARASVSSSGAGK